MRIRFSLFLILFFLATFFSVNAQSYNAYVRAGDKAMLAGDYYSASSYFFEAIKIENEDVEILYKMAESSRMFNDYINAVKYYQQVVVKDKKSEFPLSVFWLARMKQFLGDYENAKTLYNTYNSRNISSNDYYSTKARHEMFNCDTAKFIIADSGNAEIKNLGAPINSVYSDFAAQQLSDSVLYYSSLKFEVKDKRKRKTKYVSQVLRARNDNNKWKEPIAISGNVNNAVVHSCNSSISPDGKVMVFTRCNYVGSNLICELYESRWDGMQWTVGIKLQPEINLTQYTSTQPCITTNGAEGYTVYYASNRPDNSFGKLDIWKTNRNASGIYTKPENLGSVINSADDDVTPFFDALSQSLYFSSEGHVNLGGFDVFKSKYNGVSFSNPVNVGYPLNTSYNEVYFSTITDSLALVSSNRPGSMFIKARTCCYDIYQVKFLPEINAPLISVIEKDSTPIAPEKEPTYEQNVFLKLYFDNDMPDRRTLKKTTLTNYENLYLDYINQRTHYSEKFAEGLSTSEKNEALTNINIFFDSSLVIGYKGLEKFSSYVLNLLDKGNNVEIKVRGSASPLANSIYNSNLSQRRIVSIINYWKRFNGGAFNKYINSGAFIINQDPVGEDLSQKGLSDRLDDLRNSVYSPKAASERYIEVIKFIVNGKERK